MRQPFLLAELRHPLTIGKQVRSVEFHGGPEISMHLEDLPKLLIPGIEEVVE